jgi:hypothetical protein
MSKDNSDHIYFQGPNLERFSDFNKLLEIYYYRGLSVYRDRNMIIFFHAFLFLSTPLQTAFKMSF